MPAYHSFISQNSVIAHLYSWARTVVYVLSTFSKGTISMTQPRIEPQTFHSEVQQPYHKTPETT